MYGSSPLCGQDLNKVRPAPERKSTLKHVDEYQDIIMHFFVTPAHSLCMDFDLEQYFLSSSLSHCPINHSHSDNHSGEAVSSQIKKQRFRRYASTSAWGHSSQISLWFRCCTWFVMGLELTQEFHFIRVILSHKSSFLISYLKYHMQSSLIWFNIVLKLFSCPGQLNR